MERLKYIIIDEIDMVKNNRMKQFLVENVPKIYLDLSEKSLKHILLTNTCSEGTSKQPNSSEQESSTQVGFLDHTCQVYDNMLKEITVEILITIEMINKICSRLLKGQNKESVKIVIGVLLDHTNKIINQFEHLKHEF